VSTTERSATDSHCDLEAVCNVGGAYYAVADRCTHAAWKLGGEPLEGCEIVCTLHGAAFDLRTGEATRPPASKPLRTFPCRSDGGRLLVDVDPRSS